MHRHREKRRQSFAPIGGSALRRGAYHEMRLKQSLLRRQFGSGDPTAREVPREARHLFDFRLRCLRGAAQIRNAYDRLIGVGVQLEQQVPHHLGVVGAAHIAHPDSNLMGAPGREGAGDLMRSIAHLPCRRLNPRACRVRNKRIVSAVQHARDRRVRKIQGLSNIFIGSPTCLHSPGSRSTAHAKP